MPHLAQMALLAASGGGEKKYNNEVRETAGWFATQTRDLRGDGLSPR